MDLCESNAFKPIKVLNLSHNIHIDDIGLDHII